MVEFFKWKEDEEARIHTFYTLHNKPYVMSKVDTEGMSYY